MCMSGAVRLRYSSLHTVQIYHLTFLIQVTSKSAALLPVPAYGTTLLPDDIARQLACYPLDNR